VLPGHGTLLLPIKLRIAKPGTFYLCTELFGNVAKQREYVELEVDEREETDLRGEISEQITVGELIAAGPESIFDDNQAAHGAWVIETAWIEENLPEPHRSWLKDKLDGINVPGS